TLADRIVVLRDGRIEQVGTPREVYEDPANLFVAGFIGSPRMNIVDAVYAGDSRVEVGDATVALAHSLAGVKAGDQVKLGVRPEHVHVGPASGAALQASVDFAEYLGSTRYLYCYLSGGESVTVEQRDGRDYAAGEEVWLHY